MQYRIYLDVELVGLLEAYFMYSRVPVVISGTVMHGRMNLVVPSGVTAIVHCLHRPEC